MDTEQTPCPGAGGAAARHVARAQQRLLATARRGVHSRRQGVTEGRSRSLCGRQRSGRAVVTSCAVWTRAGAGRGQPRFRLLPGDPVPQRPRHALGARARPGCLSGLCASASLSVTRGHSRLPSEAGRGGAVPGTWPRHRRWWHCCSGRRDVCTAPGTVLRRGSASRHCPAGWGPACAQGPDGLLARGRVSQVSPGRSSLQGLARRGALGTCRLGPGVQPLGPSQPAMPRLGHVVKREALVCAA